VSRCNPGRQFRWEIAGLGSLQYFVHSPAGNSTNTSQPGPGRARTAFFLAIHPDHQSSLESIPHVIGQKIWDSARLDKSLLSPDLLFGLQLESLFE
jgi:hypothetical protein